GGSISPNKPCGDCCVTAKGELVEVLEFTHFYEHFTFEKTDWSERGKHLKKYLYDIMNIKKETSDLFQSEDLTQ
nr:hypothetical protein [Lachnospiraceae bacterium]